MIDRILTELKNNPKQMILFVAAAALIMVILYLNFVLIPQVVGAFGAVMRMNKAQSELNSAQTDAARIATLKKSIVSFEAKVDKYEKMLPAQQEIPSLLESLSDMAKSSGIKIVGIMPVAAKEEKFQKEQIYKETPILISAKSGYHELGRFVSDMENSDRFMKVADIQIKVSAATPKKHDVELLVLTYVLLKR